MNIYDTAQSLLETIAVQTGVNNQNDLLVYYGNYLFPTEGLTATLEKNRVGPNTKFIVVCRSLPPTHPEEEEEEEKEEPPTHLPRGGGGREGGG